MVSTQVSTFDFLLDKLKKSFLSMPDKRTGKNSRYTLADAATCSFSVFFTQEASFLSYQKRMQQEHSLSNEQTVFGVKEIPSDTQIRRLLDGVAAKRVDEVYWEGVDYLKQGGYLEGFRSQVGEKDLLVALDGTWYFSSEEIHCQSCLIKNFDDEKTYYHSMINPCVAVPGKAQVIPLPPEFIKNTDGEKKQDCEQNGAKRWLKKHGQRLTNLSSAGVTILGDDLYAHQPIIEEILNQGLNFILVCKEDSHKTLYEWTKGICEEVRVEKVTGVRKIRQETWVYRYVNDVPLRDQTGKEGQAILVNWCEVTILDEQGKKTYRNGFITNHPITKDNVEDITACGRARWKIENENNNTLKNQGYHLEHNFGHGKKHLSSLLASLNILAFMFHTLLEITNSVYRSARERAGRRDSMFDGVRTLLSWFCFKSFTSLMDFMLGHREIDIDHIPVPI